MRKLFSTALKISPVAITSYILCNSQTQKNDPFNTGLKQFQGFKTRQQHLKEIEESSNYDLVIIGGGANGAGACLEASTRGLKTLVIQKNDFGSGASSKSTKLIHGGVRYLEQVFAMSTDSISSRYQKLKLVTQAIKQRGILLRNAAFMNEKIPFVIPATSMFQSVYYYIGSIMYYFIYVMNRQQNTVKFNFPYFLHRNQLRDIFPFISDKYQSGVVYEDGCFNDTRLLLSTFLTTTLSKQQYSHLPDSHRPANIVNRAEFVDFIKDKEGKIEGVIFVDSLTSKRYKVKAKYVANCTGVWADKVRAIDNPQVSKRICIVGGAHLTYDSKISSNKFGLCLPSKDGRVLLVVPWLNSVIAGTTEKVFDEPVVNPTISLEERQFIQEQMGELMENASPSDIIDWEKARWTGLRPLVLADYAKSTKDIARSHVVQRSASGLYSLMGGKWTTYRQMGQDLIDAISKEEENKNGSKFSPSKSANVLLVGSSSINLLGHLVQQYGPLGSYLYKTYGSLALEIVKGDLTPMFGNVTKAEIDYIFKNQMALEVEDVLLRRLRVALLNQRQSTLSTIPYLTRLAAKRSNSKAGEKQIEEAIKKNIETICSYEFD